MDGIHLLQLGAGSFKIRQVDAVFQWASVGGFQNDGRGNQATLGELSSVEDDAMDLGNWDADVLAKLRIRSVGQCCFDSLAQARTVTVH